MLGLALHLALALQLPSAKVVPSSSNPSVTAALFAAQAAEAVNRRERAGADQLYGRAIALLPNSATAEAAAILTAAGANAKALGRFGEADAHFRRALAISLEVHGERNALTASAYNDLASNLKALGRFAEAEPLFRKSLELKIALTGEASGASATGYNNLASLLKAQGRLDEADSLFRRALETRRGLFGEDHESVAASYNNVASNLKAQGKYGDAQPLFERALAIKKRVLAEHDPEISTAYNNLASNLDEQGRHDAAEPLLREALAIRLRALGEDHPDTATSYNNLAANLNARGKFKDAEPLFRRSLAVLTARLADDHPSVAAAHVDLADNLKRQGRHPEARERTEKALAILRRAVGEAHPSTAAAYLQLGSIAKAQGSYPEAEPLFRQALAIRKRVLGEDHPDTAEAYNDVAAILKTGGKYAEAEPLYRQALDIKRKRLGDRHRAVATGYNNLASIQKSRGRFREAERNFKTALEIKQLGLGEEHPETATAYNNLASTLKAMGRYAESEALFRRALEVRRAALGGTHSDTAASYNNVAAALRKQKKLSEALELLEIALKIKLDALGPDHPELAFAYNNIAVIKESAGDPAQAEAYFRKALAIRLAKLGEANPQTASLMHRLARSLDRQGRIGEAEPLYRRSLELLRGAMGVDHPDIVEVLVDYADALGDQPDRARQALDLAREAARIARLRRLQRTSGEAAGDDASEEEQALARALGQSVQAFDPLARAFEALLRHSWRSAQTDGADRAALLAEAFEAAQDLSLSAAGQAFSQSAARGAAGEGRLAELTRRQQDLSAQIKLLDERLIKALSERNQVDAAYARKQLAPIGRELSGIDRELRRSFPAYAELIAPKALPLATAQQRLRPDEALLLIVPAGKDVITFAVSGDQAAWHRDAGGQQAMDEQVNSLFCQVDHAGCRISFEERMRRFLALPEEQAAEAEFDPRAAFALYRQFIAPVEGAISGKQSLYLTVSGSLGSLPLSLLRVRDPNRAAGGGDRAARDDPEWLSDRYALTNLPSISALRSLHRDPSRSARAGKAFVGYGAPRLIGANVASGGRSASDPAPAGLESLEPLPGTAVELGAMANLLGVPQQALRLGNDATEAAVRRDPDLAGARVLAFATHGLMPNEWGDIAEPGLVFTPPDTPSEQDDGILTASEAAGLSLSSDWVILSACNTATADGAANSEGLSSLARSFIYAGAEALLASHWRIDDDVTAALTVEILRESLHTPGSTRAQAHQRAMRAVRTGKRRDGSALPNWKAAWTHPAAWAPFSLIADEDQRTAGR